MASEASDHLESSLERTGAQGRCEWRPPAAQPMTDLMAGVALRTQAWGLSDLHLIAWYELAAQRGQRWMGWLPMALEYPLVNAPANTVSTVYRTEVMNPSSTAPPQALPPQSASVTTVTPPASVVPSPALWPPLQRTQAEIPKPRLITRVTTQPRREVRGGFPDLSASPNPARPETGPRAVPETVARAIPETAVSRAVVDTTPATPVAPMRATPPSETPGAIADLIAQTVQPVSLGGVELRPASAQPSPQRPSSRPDPAPPPHMATADPPPIAPTPTAPAADLDINAISEKVYQNLKRRQQLERERKGLY